MTTTGPCFEPAEIHVFTTHLVLTIRQCKSNEQFSLDGEFYLRILKLCGAELYKLAQLCLYVCFTKLVMSLGVQSKQDLWYLLKFVWRQQMKLHREYNGGAVLVCLSHVSVLVKDWVSTYCLYCNVLRTGMETCTQCGTHEASRCVACHPSLIFMIIYHVYKSTFTRDNVN